MRPIRLRDVTRWALLLFCCGAIGAQGAIAQPLDPTPELADSEIEEILSRGRISRIVELEVGVTDPLRVWVEHAGRTISGCFKAVNIVKKGVTRIPGSDPEINFTDRDIYDQAAYRLDREIGLGLVPVAVPREVRRQRGTLIHWIDDTFDEVARRQEKLEPPSPMELNRQLARMRVFDALIFNVDRNAGNILYTRGEWRLHLIDHTRSFRIYKRLPDRFLRLPTTLPRALYEGLQRLDQGRLEKLMKKLLQKGQIRALLARRDLILEKVERDRSKYGDEYVFQQRGVKPDHEIGTLAEGG